MMIVALILHNYLIKVEHDEKFINQVDREILNQSSPQEEVPTLIDDDKNTM